MVPTIWQSQKHKTIIMNRLEFAKVETTKGQYKAYFRVM